jgi:hypothetical protein
MMQLLAESNIQGNHLVDNPQRHMGLFPALRFSTVLLLLMRFYEAENNIVGNPVRPLRSYLFFGHLWFILLDVVGHGSSAGFLQRSEDAPGG